jgi:hypothetical protein
MAACADFFDMPICCGNRIKEFTVRASKHIALSSNVSSVRIRGDGF